MSAGLGVKGWPREFIPRGAARLPNIYLGGQCQAKGDWLGFDESLTKADAVGDGHECVVCGEPIARLRVFGHTGTFRTNGPPSHPRCFALALKFCPRYQGAAYAPKRATAAYVHDCGPSAERPPAAKSGWFGGSAWAATTLSDYSLTRRCKAFKRAGIMALAKADPLGERALPRP